MNTKHTPGPWRIGDAGHTVFGPRVSDVRDLQTVAKLVRGNKTIDTWKANARLIAAAPELLAALERVVPWIGRMIADGGHMAGLLPQDAVGSLDRAEAAIAKAKGESE